MMAPKYSSSLLLLVGFSCIVACGGGGTAPTDSNGPPEYGRILVANETATTLEVAFLREDEETGPRIVRTEVAPSTVADVSGGGGLLPAAAEIQLDVALGSAEGGATRVRRKVHLTVDGQMLVTIRLLDPEDPFSVAIEIATATASDLPA